MEHIIDYRDERKASRQARFPITFDYEAAEVALATAGVDVSQLDRLVVRVTDANDARQGYTRPLAYDPATGRWTLLIKVRVRKPEVGGYTDAARYVLNSTLLHELRHVAQRLTYGPVFDLLYAAADQTLGYGQNPFELEARAYGRLADATGTKWTPAEVGPKAGRAAWAIAA